MLLDAALAAQDAPLVHAHDRRADDGRRRRRPPVPSLSYTKMIAREMGKVEALVKVLLSPSDGLAETFKALLPVTANAVDFRALCELKGLKRNDVPEPPFGLFTAVGAPASSKPLADDLRPGR